MRKDKGYQKDLRRYSYRIRRPAKMLQKMAEYSRRPYGSESYDRPKHAAKASKHPGAEMSADVVIRKFREDE